MNDRWFCKIIYQWTRRKPFAVWAKRAVAITLLWGLAAMLTSRAVGIAALFSALIFYLPAFCGLLLIGRALAAEKLRALRSGLLRLWFLMTAAGFLALTLLYCPWWPEYEAWPLYFLILPLAGGTLGCACDRRLWPYAAGLGSIGLLQAGFIWLMIWTIPC